jgi:pimeloyl-ACP methyl ester carboxylesterase
MDLEIISQHPATDLPPILFIHGAFTDAWCWTEHFLPYFAEQGYPAYALSLRGHGKSKGELISASLKDYVHDVLQIVENFEKKPILVGHSMGGMVVQKYLSNQHPAQAAILMASPPPSGLSSSISYLAFTQPFLAWQLGVMFGTGYASAKTLEQALVSRKLQDIEIERYMPHLQNESWRILWDLSIGDLPLPLRRPNIPMLVLGAGKDAFLHPLTSLWTAQCYGANHHIFQDLAHAMMLESEWKTVADFMLQWLDRKLLLSKNA